MTKGTVLVTGGAGFIGSHLVDRLLENGAEQVRVLDTFVRGRRENLAAAEATGRLEIVEGDIRDRDAVARAMRDVSLVFHQAAIRVTQCAAEPRLALEVLVDGTFNVVEAAVTHGVTKIVAASSASVYGMASEFPTPETHHPYGDRTFYGAAKTFNEGILRSFGDTHGLEWVALRYFNAYGPRMDTHGRYTEVLVRWMERIDRGEPPLILGDGKQTMDFVHVEDIARANLLAANAAVVEGSFNIGTGRETSLIELARCLLAAMGSDLEPEFAPARAVNPVERRLADVRRAEEALGFRPSVSLDDGVGQLVRWWRGSKSGDGSRAPSSRGPASAS